MVDLSINVYVLSLIQVSVRDFRQTLALRPIKSVRVRNA